MRAASNLSPGLAEQHKNRSDNQQDDTERPQDGDCEKEPEKKQDKPKRDHGDVLPTVDLDQTSVLSGMTVGLRSEARGAIGARRVWGTLALRWLVRPGVPQLPTVADGKFEYWSSRVCLGCPCRSLKDLATAEGTI